MLLWGQCGPRGGGVWGGVRAKDRLCILNPLMIYFFVVVLEVLHGYCIDGLSHGNRVHDDRHSLGHLLSVKHGESTTVTAPV